MILRILPVNLRDSQNLSYAEVVRKTNNKARAFDAKIHMILSFTKKKVIPLTLYRYARPVVHKIEILGYYKSEKLMDNHEKKHAIRLLTLIGILFSAVFLT